MKTRFYISPISENGKRGRKIDREKDLHSFVSFKKVAASFLGWRFVAPSVPSFPIDLICDGHTMTIRKIGGKRERESDEGKKWEKY